VFKQNCIPTCPVGPCGIWKVKNALYSHIVKHLQSCSYLKIRSSGAQSGSCNRQTDRQQFLNDYVVLHKLGATTKYDNGRGGATSPHRAVSLFYFRKTKPLFPQITAIISQHTWKSKKQGTLSHTYDTDCTFSHRTCTSFIQIHLGMLTAFIFCIGLFLLHILMWGFVVSGVGTV